MNTMSVQNSVSTAVHENFHNRDFSIPNTENSKSPTLHFRIENTGTENRELSEFPRFQRIPLREFNYYYEHKDSNSRLVLGFKRYRRAEASINNHILLEEMLSEIDSLLENEYDWDEIGYRKPTLEDISRAKSVLIDFIFTISYEGYSLKKPYISNFEEGGASIKWKIGDRTLYLEIGQHVSIYSKVWRESGKPHTIDRPLLKKDYLRLWKWIINEE